ncbi:hypothetical protein B9Z55_027619 [Caenorhabditis nigoni]|uniref:DNA-directed DNA polymerase n=1 Tax=Caenorhabditis nigoni TaxID=1611254 RepID=A0A2G5SEK1_9PELO|nr:hypothetical protein B9Z55_027619 [Caenorhabditis nigoni]
MSSESEDNLVGDAFPTKDELAFFEKFAEIVDGADLVRTSSETVVMHPKRLVFKNLDDLPKDVPPHISFGRLFDIFIRRTIQMAGGDLVNTRYWLNLSHPGYREADGYWIMHKTYKTANGHTLINLIAKHSQSPNDARPEIGFDETMILSMRVFKQDLSLTGKGNRIPDQIMKKFGLKSANVVGTSHCLPKALMLGKLWSDYNTCQNEADKKEIFNRYKNLVRTNRPDEYRAVIQMEHAENLLQQTNIDPEIEHHTLEHLENFKDCLSEYRICVWSLQNGAPFPTVLCEFNKNARGLISLFHSNDHFEFFKPTVPTVNVSFCWNCRELVGGNHGKKCKQRCRRCGLVNCEPSGKESHCTKCNNVFHSDTCFETHLKKTSPLALPYCDRYQKCTVCSKVHERDSYSKKVHKCYHNHFCNICMERTTMNHKCVHAAPTAASRKRQLEKQESWAMVIYDIESIVTSSSSLEGAVGVKHIPNVLCYKVICNECMGDFCPHCGPVTTFSYQHGIGTVLEQFAKFLKKDARLKNAYIIAHNGGRYDHVFMLEELIKNDYCQPNFVMAGQAFISADVTIDRKTTLHFRDSAKYIPMRLSQLPKAFNLNTESKGYFPYMFNHPDNYGKRLPGLPPIEYYEPRFMSTAARSEFELWYEENKDTPFNFDEEIVKYCKNDVQILVEAVAKFITLCQEKMNGWNPIIQSTTLASYVMHVMKHEHIQSGVIGVIPENGYEARNNSRFALKYLLWLEKKNPNLKLVHKLRDGGEYYAVCENGKSYHVDGYNPETREIFEVHGCLWHGCEKCYPNKEVRCPRNKNSKMGELYDRTKVKENDLRQAGYTVHVAWECDIREKLENDAEMKFFFKNCRHTHQLLPREAMYGGRTQQFQSLIKADSEHSIEYFDFCSLYPYVNMRGTSYPIGSPERITINFMPIEKGKLPYRGLIYCDILPPTDRRLTVLPTRVDGKLLFVLCRTCGQSKKSGKCTHKNVCERFLTGVWCSDELDLALREGYEILKYHEVWHWPEDKWFQGGFFESFMTPLLKMKHEASGWPQENMSEKEKQAHIDAIQKDDGILMDEENIKKNPALRSLAKLFLNSTWGKFAQNPCKSETKLIHLNEAIEATKYISATGFKPQCFKEWCDSHILVSRKPVKENVQSAKFTNIVYGALTTSAARIKLYGALKQAGMENLIYCDTDSIIFRQKRGEDVLGPLRGDGLGQLTDETPNGWKIDETVAMAPKVYAIKMVDGNDGVKYSVKAKGITLNSETASKVNFETMKQQVVDKLNGKPGSFSVRSLRMKRGSNILDGLESVIQTKRLRTNMDKGNFDESGIYEPFGYIENCTLVNDYPY